MRAYQLRMARAALSWSAQQLAQISGVSVNTIGRIENGADAKQSTFDVLAETFKRAGLRIDEDGVSFSRVDWRQTNAGDLPPPRVPVLVNFHIGAHKTQRATFDATTRCWTLVDDDQRVLSENEVRLWAPGPWPIDSRWLAPD